MESSDSQQASTSSREDESTEDQHKLSCQTSAVDVPSTQSTDSDDETYKSANEKSEDENTIATTSGSEQTEETKSKQRVTAFKKPTPDVSTAKIPSADKEIFGWWYQYLSSSLYGQEGGKKSGTDRSGKMSSSMRVVQWLEGNKRSSRAVRRKEKETKERKKFRKEHSVLLRQDEDKKVSKSHQQQQQQDSSVRGPLSIRPSYIEFLQKISKGTAEPAVEELEKEWPPDKELFKGIISTPVSTEKKEDTESEPSKPKMGKKSAESRKASKKSKKSSASSKGKKGKKKKGKRSKSPRRSKGKGKKKSLAKKKGSGGSRSSKKSKSSKASRATSGGKKKRKGGKKKGSVASSSSRRSQGKGKKKGTHDNDKEEMAKKALMRKSFAEAQIRQSVFAENFKKGSRKSFDGFGRALSKTLRKQEKAKCNIPAAIHLYYGERADFLTEGELEEIRQRLNRQIEDKEREKRIPLIRSIHKSVMRLVGFCLKVKPSKVEDGVLDFDSHIELLDSIVSEGGRRIIIFSFHKYGPKAFPDDENKIRRYRFRVMVTGYANDPRRMEKAVLILFRTRNNFNADSKTFPEEYYVHRFLIGEANPILGLSPILESVMKPNTLNSNQWGALSKVPGGPKRRKDFLIDLNGFIRYMNRVAYDQEQRITFEMTPAMSKAMLEESKQTIASQLKTLKKQKQPKDSKKKKDKKKEDKKKKGAQSKGVQVKGRKSVLIDEAKDIKKSNNDIKYKTTSSPSLKKTPTTSKSDKDKQPLGRKTQVSVKDSVAAEERKRLRLRRLQRKRDMKFKRRMRSMLSKLKRKRAVRRSLEKTFKDKIETLELELQENPCYDPNKDTKKSFRKAPDFDENKKIIKINTAKKNVENNYYALLDKVCFTRKLRGEPGLATPDAELEHWMHIITIFNDALEFSRSKECQDFLKALEKANSPLVKKWAYCIRFCQLNRNYAVNNLIYLNLCRIYWWVMNKSTPQMISACVPGVLAAFKQMFSIETYRAVNKPSGFLRKVTNQMISACANYITDDNRSSLWKLPKTIVLQRITDCMRLYLDYCLIYHDMEQRAKLGGHNSGKEAFAGSDIFVIGKFLTFKNRLAKIADILSTRLAFSVLEDSRIKGVNKVARRVKRAYEIFPKTNHNLMDYRDVRFDNDYTQFREKITEQENALQALMNRTLYASPNMPVWCLYLKRWNKIPLDCLNMEMVASHAYNLYMTEITKLRDLYNKRRRNPGIPKLIAPIAARLLWIQALTTRITFPLEVMKNCNIDSRLPWTPTGIKVFNALLKTFCLYEMIHREVVYKKFALVRIKMTQPLLKSYPKKGYKINFHPVIREFFDETKHIYTAGHAISSAQYLDMQLMERMVWSYEMLTILLEKFIQIKKSIPYVFCNIGKPLMNQLNTHFRPFFKKVTWKTLSIVMDLHKVDHFLDDALWFHKTTMDIMEARFNVPCTKIENSVFIYVSPLTVGHKKLLRQNLAYQEKQLQELQIISENMEITVVELINRFVLKCKDRRVDQDEKWNWYNKKRIMIKSSSVAEIELDPRNFIHRKYTPKSTAQFAFECMEVYNYFNQQRVEAVATAIRQSLALLNERIRGVVRSKKYKTVLKVGVPIFFTNVILLLPKVRISPSLMEVQMTVNKIVTGAMRIARDLKPWGFYDPHTYVDARALAVEVVEEKSRRKSEYHSVKHQPSIDHKKEKKHSVGGHKREESQMEELSESEVDLPPLKETSPKKFDSEGRTIITLYRAVYSNKDVVRQIVLLQGQFLIIAKEVDGILAEFARYRKLWAENKESQIAKFLLYEPAAAYIREKFIEFDKIEQEIRSLHETDIVLPMLVSSNYLYSALYTEIQKWREALGSELKKTFRGLAEEVFDFINTHTAIMNRSVHNLSTVRTQMQCMKEIRDGFVEIDQELFRIEEVYATLQRYNIKIPYTDLELVYGLRYSFTKMNKLAATMQSKICELQKPLKKELMAGLAEFKAGLEQFDYDFETDGPMTEGLTAKEASDRVTIMQGKFDDLWERYELLRSGQELFGMEKSDFPTLMERKKEFNLLQKLYGLYNQVNRVIDGYYHKVWTDVDIEKINEELSDFQNKCRKLPKIMKDWPAYIELKKKIDDFTESCPLLEMMANPSMKERHWTRLETLLKCKFEVESPDFTLGDIMAAPLLKNKDEVEDICISAVKEKDIEAKLKQVQGDWTNVNLQFTHFKNRGELLVKGTETAEIISLIEDSMMVLSSLLSNRYNAPFRKEIQLWCNNLSQTGEILEKWLAVQNLWIYLEAVFVGGDIAKQLPAEAKRFANIDRSWVKLMQRAHEFSSVIETCVGDDSMSKLLPFLFEQLESCQKSLTGYLEQKRIAFPRFFFCSDPTLLEILGQSSDSHAIQHHLLDVFESIAKLKFSKRERDRVMQMTSKEDEKITLFKSFLAQGGVEHWLGTLLKIAKGTLGQIIGACYDFLGDPEFKILKMIEKFPAQVGLLGLQLWWTKESERALRDWKYDPRIFKKANKYFLNILNVLIDQTTRDLTKVERMKFETLVTIHVHQKDIFEDLTNKKVRSVLDFEWTKQERFYYNDETDDCLVKVTDVEFIYQNEYLGITDRLVITPLTDRCYITLAQSIGLSMGGAPAGPAGTGKTETTKDMGKSLGKYVVVLNCSDQMDVRALARVFKGLAQSGSWGCFDEFNRIELPVLSVAAQQISILLMAKKEKATHFVFSDGDRMKLDPEFGIFITMNPGYAGRQELPENLKINFRSVAMMVPDRQIIMRVKLAACGFRDNLTLSRKFFVLYKLCEEQLSKQVHYDFGLRNILSVLRTLGAQKRANPTETEDTTLMRVLRDMNVSKLVDEDEPLFVSLIEDLFVGLKLTSSFYKEMQAAIESTCQEMVLTNYPYWNLKVIQLYETSLVRHGLMTMGPTGTGKTTCIRTLLTAFTKNGRTHKEMRMNPKAITAPQMFGRLDVATNDWTDGIFSTLWRRALKIKKDEHVWIVLDGPVDAVWIENLNSVLDDNKLLTLANGDRLPMAVNSKLVFEPDNVDNASPATVSRMGMVFLSSSVLPWAPILDGWLKKRKTYERNVWRPIFDKIYQDAYECVSQTLAPKMRILEAIYIRQTCDLLDGFIPKAGVPGHESKTYSNEYLEKTLLMAIMWSLGAVLELDDRAKLEDLLINHKSKLKWPALKSDESIFEFLVNNDGQWLHWNNRVEDFVYPSDSVPEYATILVPNVDNVRTNYLIDVISKQKKAVLLIGEQGTAKTVMIKGYMSKYNPEVHLQKALNFSSATTPNMFQRIIESYVDKRVGFIFGPPYNRSMTVFIDDINMPVVNSWGDQETNEIVRQLMETGGFYNLEKPGEFNTIQDLQFLAAMIHPGGGRNDIPHRLKRQFNIFNCTIPSNKSMDKIFNVLGEGYFCSTRFRKEVVAFIPFLIPLTRKLWQRTKTKMLPTPAKFHYVFNLRDLSRIWEGMLTIKGPECEDQEKLLKLWKHECERVMADRFTTDADKEWFTNSLSAAVEEFIQVPISQGKIQYLRKPIPFSTNECYFVDFLRDAPEATGDESDEAALEAPKIYEEVPRAKSDEAIKVSRVNDLGDAWSFLKEKLIFYMDSYNETARGTKMDMVFFHDAMVHLMIISRIIRTARGSALLVGVGGSGKQTLTKLATFIAGYSSHQIILTRIYNVNNFMEDLKHLYRVAGGRCQGITFIFTDNDIKDEAFLEFLNNILSSGEVANLFTKEENDSMCNDLVMIMKKMYPKRSATLESLYDFFIQQSRKNLHIVLCFSPVSEKFRSRALKFPGLISGCTIDWFSRWPRSALIEVAHHFLDHYQMVCPIDVKNKTIEFMGQIQDEVADACTSYFERFRRRTYVTPKSFLSFLEGYKHIYSQRFNEIKKLRLQMTTGLNKLAEAAESVVTLKAQLQEGEKEIAKANAAAEEILKEVMSAAEIAMKVQAEVKVMAENAQALVKDIAKDKQAAEDTLERARPALEAAEAALLTIKAADIATVRKLGKPPYLITVIMDAVLILFNRRIVHPMKIEKEKNFFAMNWAESLKVMGDSKFLFNLQNYPKDTITGEMVDLLRPYLRLPTYTFESAKQACGNVAGLLQWTIAMCAFYNVNKEVIPLKANLAALEGKLDKAQKQLAAAEQMKAEKERELKAVQEQADKANRTKQEIQEKADRCQHKMNQATALISGLSGEQKRWTAQLAQFKAETDRLIGDVVLLTGFLSYCGPFNQEFRVMLQKGWVNQLVDLDIPFTHNLKIVELLVDAATIGEWNIHGLPNDELSIQNGIIATKAARYPLLIDPQNQGSVWIKNKEAGKLKVTSLNSKYFRQDLEDCLSLGRTLLIEDIFEELDPVLDNVLEKNYVKVGTSLKVKLSDKEVDVDKNFKLFITTKMGNPSYSPEISARTSIIDFTVTMKGLEDQLLGRVIMKEKAELELERTSLVSDVTNMKRKMIQLEANLLHKLTTVEGSLVDDESVLEVLNNTQSTAAVVRSKLETAAETEIKINLAREEYRPVAARGSVLYFLIVEMSLVNCMYQTSLVQFLEKFDISMDRSEKSAILTKRIDAIIEYLTHEIFRYISRGLYENHKFMFVLMLALKIDIFKGKVTHEEFQTFIKGGAALNLNAVEPKPPYPWITDMMWLNIIQLSKLEDFEYLPNQLATNEKVWRWWYQRPAPEAEELPDRFEHFDTFRKTLIIRSLCPDRLVLQAQKYVKMSLGKRYAEAVILNLEELYEESHTRTPMICFLTMGADPTTAIEALAKKMEFGLDAISMGQGQEIIARVMMKASMEEGKWLLLQNCHLGIAYMHEIFDTITNTKNIDDGFRLWITTEPTPRFPISILHISFKFTNDPPQGLKAGLTRTYLNMAQEMLEYTNAKPYLPLVYGISFLHSVVQERRRFGPIGWNIPYEFNFSDWYASIMFCQNHLDSKERIAGVDWVCLRYMLAEVMYGGRVTDDYDKRLLLNFANLWFSEDMLEEGFFFYKGYPLLKHKQKEEYLEDLGKLPEFDDPFVFGLHPNAYITLRNTMAMDILDTILSVQPKESGSGGGESRESVVTREVSEMLSKLPEEYNPHEVKARLKEMGALNSLNIFLRQEIDRMQRVIKLVKITLKDLLLAIEGIIIMNETLREAFDAIYDAKVPMVWKRGSWESASLGFWYTELIMRNKQFVKWCFKGRPTAFWMTGFFNPQGFLTAMKQEVARAHKGWALDAVYLDNKITKHYTQVVSTGPKEGVYVYGLYLDGCSWDKKQDRLVESAPKVIYTEMPMIHIYAINSNEPRPKDVYTCPVYKKPRRTDLNFITPLWLPCKFSFEHWILRGVALLCDIK